MRCYLTPSHSPTPPPSKTVSFRKVIAILSEPRSLTKYRRDFSDRSARSTREKEESRLFVSFIHRNEIVSSFLSLSLSSLRPRNNLFVLLSTAEFIAASLPETRPQENPLRVRSLIFSRSTRFFARSYLRSRSSRGRESEYRTRKRERE